MGSLNNSHSNSHINRLASRMLVSPLANSSVCANFYCRDHLGGLHWLRWLGATAANFALSLEAICVRPESHNRRELDEAIEAAESKN